MKIRIENFESVTISRTKASFPWQLAWNIFAQVMVLAAFITSWWYAAHNDFSQASYFIGMAIFFQLTVEEPKQ